ncbi:MAG: hypothetical protein IJF97_00620 [Eggerthellaceae bacterium]|nr:hypothetical protein [Eggerthellaceae bacterium]MBQ3342706.1 hypothetical protein [Kiritimatiellia bacterium]
MNAEQYLSQVRELHTTLRALKMRLDEAKYTMDMLKSVNLDGMPKGEARTLEEVIAEYEERMDEYVREMMRWTALKEQAVSMLDRARTRLLDGSAHAIRVTHIDVVEMYYIGRMSREHVAYALDYSVPHVDRLKAEALVWLDNSTDVDGFPLVPIVSE